MSARLHYTFDEIMADREFASRLGRSDVRFHGGLDAEGNYVPPRSLHRLDAIAAWCGELEKDGCIPSAEVGHRRVLS